MESSLSHFLHVGAQIVAKAVLVDGAGSEFQYGLRRLWLACRETIAIEFEEEHAHNEARTFVPVDERTVFDDTRGVLRNREGGWC